jgi:hypothetical protein
MARKLTVEKRFNDEGVIFYKEGLVKFLGVRCSYPHLDVPQQFKRDNGSTKSSYSIEGLIESDRFQKSKAYLVEKIRAIMEAKNCKCPKANWFILEGDPDERPELEGVYRIKAGETRKPLLFDENGEEIEGKDLIREVFFPGAVVDILVEPWGMLYKDENTTSKRVCASLRSVKFRADDGVRFGEEPIDTSEAWDDDEDDWEVPNAKAKSSKSSRSSSDEEDEL